MLSIALSGKIFSSRAPSWSDYKCILFSALLLIHHSAKLQSMYLRKPPSSLLPKNLQSDLHPIGDLGLPIDMQIVNGHQFAQRIITLRDHNRLIRQLSSFSQSSAPHTAQHQPLSGGGQVLALPPQIWSERDVPVSRLNLLLRGPAGVPCWPSPTVLDLILFREPPL